MGESKHRKATDPNYGKPKPELRGLIISPPIEIDGGRMYVESTELDSQELRSSLLYWDRLSVPASNIIYVHAGADAEYLQNCGILERRSYSFHGVNNGSDSLIEAQLLDFETRESEQPGVWSLGGGKNSVLIKGKSIIEEQGSALSLYNALPVPRENTPLAEILEFKHKRAPELYAVREHIDQLCKEISASNDSAAMLSEKLRHMDLACSDLVRTTKEFQLPFYISSLSASINLDYKTAMTATTVWGASQAFGLNTTTAAIASTALTALSFISLKADVKFQSIKRPASPFKYAYYVERDLA